MPLPRTNLSDERGKRHAAPARYPPTGTWPGQMRADMTAAYLDFRDTSELSEAVARREAPPPSALRGKGRKREPVWSKDDLDRHIAPSIAPRQDEAKEDLRALV